MDVRPTAFSRFIEIDAVTMQQMTHLIGFIHRNIAQLEQQFSHDFLRRWSRICPVDLQNIFGHFGSGLAILLYLAWTIHKCCRALASSFARNESLVGRPYALLRTPSSEFAANKGSARSSRRFMNSPS